MEDAHTILFALMRTATHPAFRQVGEQAAELIASQPDPFARAAPALVATLPQSDPLRDGLLRLGQEDPAAFQETAYTALDQLPKLSVSTSHVRRALTATMTGILRPLAEANPELYLPQLAMSLHNLGVRLATPGSGRPPWPPPEKQPTSTGILLRPTRRLPPRLAASLNSLGARMAEAGRLQTALAAAEEVVYLFVRLPRPTLNTSPT